MAIFHITPATSVFTDALHTEAFNSDSPGADTLIVDQGAFLISANFGNAAFLAPTGAWTVSVNGSIVSVDSSGILLGEDIPAASTIKVGVDGEVQGLFGMTLLSSANINNAGTIDADLAGISIFNAGTHTIINSGEITGASGFAISVNGTSNNTVHNSGEISGGMALSSGNDTVTNSGVLRQGDVFLGDGTNTLTNSGRIFANVFGGSGADTVTNFAIVNGVVQSGTMTGTVQLGDGNDTFLGGINSETVQDNNGADTYKLGGGHDTYIATGNSGADGNDLVRGGLGVDTYDASAATNNVRINLDTIAHDFSPFDPGAQLVAANTAFGTDISRTGKDTIIGFENATGGAGVDILYGSAAANVLRGGGGGDFLAGFGGNDTLDGGAGSDELFGGAGKDVLTGGAGFDTFHYTALSDSGLTAGTPDLVADFEPGTDKIDLSFIDANTKNAAGTNDAFTFIGTNVPFTGVPGQLHAFWSAIGQIIEADVNGDKKADFSIEIADPTHAITLTSASFVL